MTDGMTWKESLQQEKEKLKEMNAGQKWSYFKSYYLVKTLIVLAIVIALISMLHDFRLGGREVLISGSMLNTAISDEGYAYLTDGYFEAQGGDEKKQVVHLATENYIDFSGENPEMESTARQMALFTQITAGDIDYLILDQESLIQVAEMGVCTKVDQLLTQELTEQLNDKLVYQKDPETGKEFAAAIALSAFPCGEVLCAEPENIFLAFTCTEASAERIQSFLNYLLQ